MIRNVSIIIHSNKMKIALIMNDNSYAGREYLYALKKANIQVDLINIGSYEEFNTQENLRCGGFWNPPKTLECIEATKKYNFTTLKAPELMSFLKERQYDLGIQGGTGILKASVIESFKYGILNFHPGDLPLYRGCSAPEWQLIEGKEVVCTCHLVDEGIDSGMIYKKCVIYSPKMKKNYYEMRASLYPSIATFVVDVIKDIDETFLSRCYKQDERIAIYRKYIGDDNIRILIDKMEEK